MTKAFDVAQKLDIPVVAIRSEGKAGNTEATAQVINYISELCQLAERRGIKNRG